MSGINLPHVAVAQQFLELIVRQRHCVTLELAHQPAFRAFFLQSANQRRTIAVTHDDAAIAGLVDQLETLRGGAKLDFQLILALSRPV